MKTLKDLVTDVFMGDEGLREAIAKACRKMAVESGTLSRDKVENKLQKYLFPQLMRAEVVRFNTGTTTATIETVIADVFKEGNMIEISWEPEMILMTKKYLRSKSNGTDTNNRIHKLD